MSPVPVPSVRLAALALAVAAGCSGPDAQLQLPPSAVGVVEVLAADLPERAIFVGQTRAVQRVEVRVRVEGLIERKRFRDGDRVEEGQVLFEIDARPYRAAVLRARADVVAAQAQLERARADLGRSTELFERDAISRSEYDVAKANARVAEANVAVARAVLQGAQLDLGYTRITSPLAGFAGDTTVDLGNLVGPGTQSPLVVVTRLDPIFVEFSADERLYLETRRRVREAAGASGGAGDREAPPLSLLLADGTPYAYQGELVYVSPEVNRETGTLQLRALFPNPDGMLKPGLFGRVVFRGERSVPRILVPQEALVRKQAGTFVFVLGDGDVVEERKVRVGDTLGELVMVAEGLAAGDRVVAQGVQKIRNGATVAPNDLPALDLASDPLSESPPAVWEGELTLPTSAR